MKVKVCLVEGVEGNSIQINDYRICGPKAWGGGKVLKTWDAEAKDILKAIERKLTETGQEGKKL